MKEGKFRKAVFVVIYSIDSKDKIKYALLKRKKHWKGWEFTKGKIEHLETKKQAAKREAIEETGLKILSLKQFKETGRYYYKKPLKDRPGLIGQTYTLFAAKTNKQKNKFSLDHLEHTKGIWVSFKEAYKLLTWNNQKKCLKIVNDWLKNKKY